MAAVTLKDLQGLPHGPAKTLRDAINAALGDTSFDASTLFDSATNIDTAIQALAKGVGVKGSVAVHKVRGVGVADVADLGAFDVDGAAADGLTYVEGERIYLNAQSTGAENGPYVVGAVAGGVAPLTRPADWEADDEIPPGTLIAVAEGDVFGGATLKIANTGDVTVDTDTPTVASVGQMKMALAVAEADLTDADGSQTLAIGTLPANSRVLGVNIKLATPFSGGEVADMTIDIGATDTDMIVDGADVFAAAVNGNASAVPAGVNPHPVFATATAIVAVFTCGSDDVADANAGACTIEVIYCIEP